MCRTATGLYCDFEIAADIDYLLTSMAGAAFIAIYIRLHPAEFGPQTIARPSGVTLLGHHVARPV